MVKVKVKISLCTSRRGADLTYLLIYLLKPWSRLLFEKLTGSQLVKKFTHISWNQTVLYPFTLARYLYISWASLTYLLIYLIKPWSRLLFEKLTGSQLVKKFSQHFMEPDSSLPVYTCPLPVHILSQLDPVHNPHTTYFKSILILFSHPCLGLASGLFPSGFPTKTLYTPLISPIPATCLAHLILLHLIIRTKLGEQYRSLNLRSPN